MQRTQVFISYSHADAEYLGRLKVHLRPFERQGAVDLWADSRITAGQRWKQEIAAAMDRAVMAILLVSADFLASDFIAENELPPLLEAAQKHGVKILPVVLKPCAFSDLPAISQFQSVNDPKKPLVSLTENDREQVWYDLAVAVKRELQVIAEAAAAATPAQAEPSVDAVSLEPGLSLFGEEFADPRVVNEYFVYQYQHVDELAFMRYADEALSHHPRYNEVIERVKYRLKSEGWEGDGRLRLLWLPPVVGAGMEDSWGVGIWFVKQLNNGTAWLASPVPLPFARLMSQNL